MTRQQMTGRTRRRVIALLMGVSTLACGGTEAHAAVNATKARTATTSKRQPKALDTISISAQKGLTPELIGRVQAIVKKAKAQSTVIDQGTIGLVSLRRGEQVVQAAPVAWTFPISTTVMDPAAAGRLKTNTVEATLAKGQAVLGKASAKQRSAKVGDVLQLVHWPGPPLVEDVTVGAIVADDEAAGAELLIAPATAALLELRHPSRIVVWGIPRTTRDAVAASIEPLVGKVFVRRSWDKPGLDGPLSQPHLKELLGEFTVRRTATTVSIDPGWVMKNIISTDFPIIGRARCNTVITGALRDSLHEIEMAGLAPLINIPDTARSGGCFNGREIRTAGGVSGKNLSRHSWAAAIDINPSANRFGRPPAMDARIVDVFRRHGFAWGGTWATPDGMHFEYIGTPRVTGPPLPVAPPTTTTTSTSTSTSTSTTTTTTTTTTTSTSTTTVPPTTTAVHPSTTVRPSTTASTIGSTTTTTAVASTTTVVPPSAIAATTTTAADTNLPTSTAAALASA